MSAEPTSDKHYEEEFKFPLWKLIKQRAVDKDTSYVDALNEVLPEYCKTINYRDIESENKVIIARWNELSEVAGGDVIAVDMTPREKGN